MFVPINVRNGIYLPPKDSFTYALKIATLTKNGHA